MSALRTDPIMNRSQQPLVSVLTPLYNGEPYVRQCIEAVLAQTYSNWEYIIVNNCSTDNSLSIAEEYAAREPRIRIQTNREFVGAEANHNIALRYISEASKYIKFAHADDWLFPECIEKMVQVAEDNPSVGLVGAYRLHENYVSLNGLEYPSTVVSGRAVARGLLLGKFNVFGSYNSTLLRTDLVRLKTPFYNESNIHADTEACYHILQTTDYGFVHQLLTFTRSHDASVSSSISSLNTSLLGGGLFLLLRYGPVFLNEKEFRARKAEYLKRYYAFLGKNVLKMREKSFWKYHVDGLRELGIPLSKPRLCASAVIEGIRLCCDPPRMRRVLERQFTAKKSRPNLPFPGRIS